MDVEFGQVMVGLVGIVYGLAVLVEPSFAARIPGWRSPRWPASCSVAAGITLVAAGFADHLGSDLHLVTFLVAVLSGVVAWLVAHVGRAEVTVSDEGVSVPARAGVRPPEPAEPPG
jgi:hypothetical protein